METIVSMGWKETAEADFRNYINEGLQDVKNGKLIAVNEFFRELEKRYSAYERVRINDNPTSQR